jgi:transcriptional regulator with XRE-family HTH domain
MDRLREFMREQGFNQTELARKLNYPDESISMLLSGKRKPSGLFRWRFGLVFGFEAATFIFADPPTPEAQPESPA